MLSLAAVSGVFGTKLNDLLSNRFDLPGTESDHARTLLVDHFGQRDDSGYTIVFSGDIAPAAEAAALKRAAGVLPDARVGHPAARGPGTVIRQDRHAPRAPAGGPARRADAGRGRRRCAAARVYVTGQTAINHDLQPVFDADLQRGEEIAVPIAVLVLLIIFGTLDGDARAAADGRRHGPATLGLLWIVAHELNMAIYVTNLVTLIGIAIAIDYSLLVVYRFREELLRRRRRAAGAAHDDEHGRSRGALLGRDRGHRARHARPDSPAVHPLDGHRRPAHPAGLDQRRPHAAARAAGDVRPRLLRLRVPLIGLRPESDGGVWARIAETIMRRPGARRRPSRADS